MSASTILLRALSAHGGLERWSALRHLSATGAIGGGLWAAKGHAHALDRVTIHADPHRPLLRYADVGPDGGAMLFTPDRVVVYDRDGRATASRSEPRPAIAARPRDEPWDALDLAYFSGYAMWTYLTIPFVFAGAGFAVSEGEPWHERGERWDRLHVRFPEHVPSHSARQTFYVDADGLLRRHDYQVDVLGGLQSAQYLDGHRAFDGFVFPTRRRVYARQPDNHPDRGRVAVAIDIASLELH
ncbi:MAG TPA: hypothetical protein VFS43_25705 [Polyangiaceae bacterium]|nr:hypothetical protein [Polyangiaceae bacterium]